MKTVSSASAKISADISLHLEEKFPTKHKKFFNNIETTRVPMLELKENNEFDILKQKTLIKSRSIQSPGMRKRNFFLNNKSKVSELNLRKLEEEKAKPSGKGFSAFLLSKNVKLAANKFLSIVRRKSFFSDTANLNKFHYDLINDLAAFPLEKPEKEERKRSIWISKGIEVDFPKFKRKYSGIRMGTVRLINMFLKLIPAFNPNSTLKLLWDLINVTLIIFQLLLYTFERGFMIGLKGEKNFQVFSLICMLVLFTDVFISVNTFYFKEGVPIKDNYKILLNYVKGRFFADMLACLTLTGNFIESEVGALFDLNILLVFKLLKYAEFEEKIKNILITSPKSESIYKIVILIWKVLLTAHLMACGWHFIAIDTARGNPRQMNWLKIKGIETDGWSQRYLYSIYWGVTTMLTVGYGDITPTNPREMAFNIGAMLSGCALFCYSMNYIGEILRIAGRKEKRKKEQLEGISKMLSKKNLPSELQARVRKYLEFIWEQEVRENPEQENFIMNKLSSSLRDEVYLHTNVKLLKAVKIFNFLSQRTMIRLASCMKKIRFSPEEFVYKKGDREDSSLFFIIEGNLKVVTESDQSKSQERIIWTSLKKGDFFGLHELITGSIRTTGVVSEEFSSLFQITRQDFINVLRGDPEDYEKFCKIKDEISLNMNWQSLAIDCNSCGMNDHRIEDCKLLSYRPDSRSVISRHCNEIKRYARSLRRKTGKSKKKRNALAQILIVQNCREEFLELYKHDEDVKELKEAHEKVMNPDISDYSSTTSPRSRTLEQMKSFSPCIRTLEHIVSPKNKFSHFDENRSFNIPLIEMGGEASNEPASECVEIQKSQSPIHQNPRRQSIIFKKIQKKPSFTIHPITSSVDNSPQHENAINHYAAIQQPTIKTQSKDIENEILFANSNNYPNSPFNSSNNLNINHNNLDYFQEAELVYDHVRIFKHYFPHCNIENVVKKMNRSRRK